MTIKEQLQELRDIDNHIEAKIQELDDMYNTLKSVDYSTEKVQTSTMPDLSTLIAKMDEKNREIENCIDELYGKKSQLSKIVDSHLSGDEWQVIHYKYFCRSYTWDRLSKKMYRSRRTLFRIHDKAIEKLSKI